MIEFSLFLNSRGRPKELLSLLDSIYNTCHDITQIEILINIDLDDMENQEEVMEKILEKNYPVTIFLIERPKNLHTALNSLAEMTAGNYLFVLNDDVVFLTENWDKIILDETQSIKNEVYYIHTTDTSMDKGNGGYYSSFPILTRAAYEKLGYFMDERLVGLGADVCLYRVFNEVGRIKKVDIVLDHIYHNTYERVVNPDKTAIDMRRNTANNYIDCFTMDITEEVKRLRETING